MTVNETTSTDQSNTVERYENIATDIIEEHDLNHGNSEISFNENCMYITIEAPSHSTMTVDVALNPELTDEEISAQIVDEIVQAMMNFNAEKTFEELWSKELSEHTNMGAFTFVRILQEDEEFFQELARTI